MQEKKQRQPSIDAEIHHFPGYDPDAVTPINIEETDDYTPDASPVNAMIQTKRLPQSFK